MADRRVFGMPVAGRDRAHHHLAGIHADARLDRQVAAFAAVSPNSASSPPASAAPHRARAADGPRAQPARRTARRCRRRSIARCSRRSDAPRRSSACSAGSTIARASSGSRSSINSIEPLMSANSAVTVLRSPSTAGAACFGLIRSGSMARAASLRADQAGRCIGRRI